MGEGVGAGPFNSEHLDQAPTRARRRPPNEEGRARTTRPGPCPREAHSLVADAKRKTSHAHGSWKKGRKSCD